MLCKNKQGANTRFSTVSPYYHIHLWRLEISLTYFSCCCYNLLTGTTWSLTGKKNKTHFEVFGEVGILSFFGKSCVGVAPPGRPCTPRPLPTTWSACSCCWATARRWTPRTTRAERRSWWQLTTGTWAPSVSAALPLSLCSCSYCPTGV